METISWSSKSGFAACLGAFAAAADVASRILNVAPPYTITGNEPERLAALFELGILDAPPKAEFENLVDLARQLINAPIALIGHLDAERQWFSAVCGLSTRQTSRDVAFCNYPVATNATFVIGDARKDPRFADNPLVTGEPYLRFYVGVPLCLQPNVVVATLCVLDTRPRRIGVGKLRELEKLARIAERLLAEHANTRMLRQFTTELAASRTLIESQSRSLALQNRLLTNASALAKMGAWEYEVATGHYRWSDGMYAVHEVDPGFQPTASAIFELYAPEQREQIRDRVLSGRQHCEGDDFEAQIVTATGKTKWVRVTSHVEVDGGLAVRRFGLTQDITEEREARLRIEWLASRDPLTGLVNRNRVELAAAQYCRDGQPYCMILVDLDGFKDVNDTYGHPAGDACLVGIATRLHAELEGCQVARVGGDEFAVLVPGTLAEALATARAVSSCVAQPIVWENHEFRLSASIGIAEHQAGVRYAELMRTADLALYESKSSGRDVTTVYRPEFSQRIERRAAVVAAARKALSRGEFSVFYQPKFALATSELAGFEALLRWHKDGTWLGPGAFREALDDPELGGAIGAFVVREVVAQAARWARAKTPFHSIAINFGVQELRDPALAETLKQLVREAGLQPEMFEVEVTENVFLSRSNVSALEICRQLREAGFTIAFDDFGTGYASLTHLREFPINVIKIDRSFVAQLEVDAGATSIVWAMVNLCKMMGLKVVAEGIETQGQFDYLRSIGCDYGQGFLMGRPAAAGDLSFERHSSLDRLLLHKRA